MIKYNETLYNVKREVKLSEEEGAHEEERRLSLCSAPVELSDSVARSHSSTAELSVSVLSIARTVRPPAVSWG